MATVQNLKKKLRGIQSTQKISKAMKTISAIKISRLKNIYDKYNEYGAEYEGLFEEYAAELSDALPVPYEDAPVCYIVLTSNKGLCGSFNLDLLRLADEEISAAESPFVIACGEQAIAHFNQKHIPYEKEFVFNDIPEYDEAVELLDYITDKRAKGKISSVRVIFQKYTNMMKQTPCVKELFCQKNENKTRSKVILIPDKQTVIGNVAPAAFQSIIYKLLLEVALGANAATLMTMRSAYDTATEYCMQLESEINRKRQNAVTADVIETASEYTG